HCPLERPRRTTPSPYTTLFRSQRAARAIGADPARIVPVPTAAGSPVQRPAMSILGSQHPEVQALVREHLAGDGILEYMRLLGTRSEEHTSELQSLAYLVCRLLL